MSTYRSAGSRSGSSSLMELYADVFGEAMRVGIFSAIGGAILFIPIMVGLGFVTKYMMGMHITSQSNAIPLGVLGAGMVITGIPMSISAGLRWSKDPERRMLFRQVAIWSRAGLGLGAVGGTVLGIIWGAICSLIVCAAIVIGVLVAIIPVFVTPLILAIMAILL